MDSRKPEASDVVAAVLWVGLQVLAVLFLLWSMGAWEWFSVSIWAG